MPGSAPDNVINSTASTSITAAITSTITTTTTAVVSTQSNLMASLTTEQAHRGALDMTDPLRLVHAADGIFLQTKTAQGLAGICVWVALFITCQQVTNKMLIFIAYAL